MLNLSYAALSNPVLRFPRVQPGRILPTVDPSAGHPAYCRNRENIGATRRTNTAFVLLAAATNRGKQKTPHIVMAF